MKRFLIIIATTLWPEVSSFADRPITLFVGKTFHERVRLKNSAMPSPSEE